MQNSKMQNAECKHCGFRTEVKGVAPFTELHQAIPVQNLNFAS
jgi:DNA-directed RNA polymerase subunit RPC12/RpoP